ncbi:MAG: hypothetical protein NTX63_00640 [Candidatus Peregrinibacteria bacterium]|nr:hypothetical protein [Candidatus Peregrinibacteria bacterium]
MKSTVTPTPRVDIVQLVQAEIDQAAERYSDIAELQSTIRNMAEEILAKLPDIITSRNIVTWRCEEPAKKAVVRLSVSEGTNEKTAGALTALRKDICMQITLKLYETYLQDIVAEINAHQAKNTPAVWGIGTVRRYQIGNKHSKLDTFIHFWRKYIEPEGKEELFRKIIVSKLSPEWQAKYQVVNKECPYDWHTMTHKKIADTLVSLKRRRDPSQKSWTLGSIRGWTGENGDQWGASFLQMWSRKYQGREDKEFKTQILPHLPIEWQHKFVLKGKLRGNSSSECPYEWSTLTTGKIVDIIKALKKSYDPATHVWNSGSIANWTDEESGKPWGRSFYNYWSRKHGEKAEEQFKAWILTYLPPEWKKTYCKRKMKNALTTS